MVRISILLFLIVLTLNSIKGFGQDSLYLDNRDGKTYRIVTIGNQTWMAENLKYDFETDKSVDKNSLVKSNFYIDSVSNPLNHEYFYNWRAACQACPSGWHLPTLLEFNQLIHKVSNGDRNAAYFALRKEGKYGFDAIDVGYLRSISNTDFFEFHSKACSFWLASDKEVSPDIRVRIVNQYHISFNHRYKKILSVKSYTKNHFSVRCIKD